MEEATKHRLPGGCSANASNDNRCAPTTVARNCREHLFAEQRLRQPHHLDHRSVGAFDHKLQHAG